MGDSGVGALGLLGIIFITLKLLGVINWSWWWVTAPFWAGLAIVSVFFMLFFAGVLIAAAKK
jgi:hypothetical protein